MASRALLDLEKQITNLTHEDKLWLLERLASTLQKDVGSDLDEMVADPDIQRELSALDVEFRLTEEDGLGGL